MNNFPCNVFGRTQQALMKSYGYIDLHVTWYKILMLALVLVSLGKNQALAKEKLI